MKREYDFLNNLPADLNCRPSRPECFLDLSAGDNLTLAPYRESILSDLCDSIRHLALGQPLFMGLFFDENGQLSEELLDRFIDELLSFHPSPDGSATDDEIALYRSFYLCSIYYLLISCDKDDWQLRSFVTLAKAVDYSEYEKAHNVLELAKHSDLLYPEDINTFYILFNNLFSDTIPQEMEDLFSRCKSAFESFDFFYQKSGCLPSFSPAVMAHVDGFLISHRYRCAVDGQKFAQVVFCLDKAIEALDSIISGEGEGSFFDYFQEVTHTTDV